MNAMPDPVDQDYYAASDSWAQDRDLAAQRRERMGWIVAAIAATIAVLEAIALVMLTPLKTVVPYTLLVDRQTGSVEVLKPLQQRTITPDRAMVRSMIAQYVIAREEFDIDSLQDSYRKVALWSARETRDRYVRSVQAGNPESPLATLPRRALVEVQIRSISELRGKTALVRFTTRRTDPGGQAQPPMYWASVVSWAFTPAAMSEADRLTNPLGFQVTRYQRDAEIVAEPAAPNQQTGPNAAAQPQTGRVIVMPPNARLVRP